MPAVWLLEQLPSIIEASIIAANVQFAMEGILARKVLADSGTVLVEL